MSAVISYNISKVKEVFSRELDDIHSSTDNNLFDTRVAQPLNDQASEGLKHNVMPSEYNNHSEAYYLYFIAVVGIILNSLVVMAIFIRKPLRKMTSGFLVHACFLDFLKCAYCIPIGTNLLSQTKPVDCDFFGATYVIIVTTSVFNMVAMVCTEAYTFGEANIGGNSRGTLICVVFGIVLVYIGSIILHLGPTLIGGHFEFQPEIGSCSFIFGKHEGYVANIMWVVITTIAMLAVFHFIRKLYKEIQVNQPNRVSFLVRTSITVLDNTSRSTCKLRKIIKDATHRAKIFVLNLIVFIVCWYPLFLLILIDMHFKASKKVYQTFSFIAWTHGAIQPVLYICFDRNLNILAKYVYCDRYQYDIDTIAQLMMNRQRNTDQSEPRYSNTEAEMSFSSPPTTIHDRTTESVIDIIREHQQMCLVQNSCNQNADNRVVNLSLQNVEQMELTNQNPQPPANEIAPQTSIASSGGEHVMRQSNHQYYVENADYSGQDDGQC